MTDATADEIEDDSPAKKSKLPLILGVVLAIAGGGGGFFVVQSGLLGGGGAEEVEHQAAPEEVGALPTFLEVDPIVISIGSEQSRMFLRFKSQLEVEESYKSEVSNLLPRILDVFNSYLRAVDLEMLTNSAALPTIRTHLLSRVQMVAGSGRVKDLLITEFVLN